MTVVILQDGGGQKNIKKTQQVFVGNLEVLRVFCNFVLPCTLLIFTVGMP